MEQVRKNRKRTHYRNYINEKLVGNKRKSFKKVEEIVSFEVIEREIIERILVKYFLTKRSRTFYRNFINRKLVGNFYKMFCFFLLKSILLKFFQ